MVHKKTTEALPDTYQEASQAVLHGDGFTDRSVLSLKDPHSGWSIAHLMAAIGHRFTDPKILLLKNNKNGVSVAAIMAENGHPFEDLSVLRDGGGSVAHTMAAHGFWLDIPDTWEWRNESTGATVLDTMLQRTS